MRSMGWLGWLGVASCLPQTAFEFPGMTGPALLYVQADPNTRHVLASDEGHPLPDLVLHGSELNVALVRLRPPLRELCLSPGEVTLVPEGSGRPVVESIEVQEAWRIESGRWEVQDGIDPWLSLRTSGECTRCPELDLRVETLLDDGDVESIVPLGEASLVVTSSAAYRVSEAGMYRITLPAQPARAGMAPDGRIWMAGAALELWRLQERPDGEFDLEVVETSTWTWSSTAAHTRVVDMVIGPRGEIGQLTRIFRGSNGRVRWRTPGSDWSSVELERCTEDSKLTFDPDGLPLVGVETMGIYSVATERWDGVYWEAQSDDRLRTRSLEVLGDRSYALATAGINACVARRQPGGRWVCEETFAARELRDFDLEPNRRIFTGEGLIRLEREGFRECIYRPPVSPPLRRVRFTGPRSFVVGSSRRTLEERETTFVLIGSY